MNAATNEPARLPSARCGRPHLPAAAGATASPVECRCCRKPFVPPTYKHKLCSPECRKERERAVNRAGRKRYRATAKGKKAKRRGDRRYWLSAKGRERKREIARRYRQRKKDAGLCICGGCWRKAKKGHTRCGCCLTAMWERRRAGRTKPAPQCERAHRRQRRDRQGAVRARAPAG